MRGKPVVSKPMRKALKAHHDPTLLSMALQQIGIRMKMLGSGSEREAYLVVCGSKKLVVKRRFSTEWGGYKSCYRPRYKHLKTAPATYVGKWEVQHLYDTKHTRIARYEKQLGGLLQFRGDVHAGNVGFDTDGTLVAFDY